MMMNDKQMSKLFWVVKGTLVAVLLYVAVETIITPFQFGAGLKPKAVAGEERLPHQAAIDPEPQTPPDYSVILDNDVFGGGGYDVEPSATPATTESVPAAALPSAEKLGLQLQGVVAGGPLTSRAIIQDTETKVSAPYRVGDKVASATIESIQSDRVVLLHRGRKAVLQMHVGTSPESPAPAKAKDKPTGAAQKPAAAAPQSPQPSARMGYVEELFHNATIEPYVRDGQTEGLRITGLKETPLTKLFGLQNGDIVQSVNGQNLNSKQKAFQVLKKARTQPSIDLRLLRDKETKELSFDL
jgi:type II secretion system protein C